MANFFDQFDPAAPPAASPVPVVAQPTAPAGPVSISVPPGAPVQPASATPDGPSASTTSISIPPGAPVQPTPARNASPAGAPAPKANFFDQFDAPAAAVSAGPAAPAGGQQAPGYQQALAAAQNTDINTPTGQRLIALANGPLFGQAANVAGAEQAGLQYLKNAFTGGKGAPTGAQVFDATRDAMNQSEQQFGSAHPIENAALNIAGSIPSGAAAGKLILAAPSTLARVGATVAAGAVPGAIAGEGANPNNPIAGAVTGAGVGAILGAGGAALPIIAAPVKNLVNSFRPEALGASAADRAAQYLAGKMAATGVTPADITASATPVSEGGQTVGEALGPQGIGKMMALSRSPDVVLPDNGLAERVAGQTDRLVSGFHAATGVDPTTAEQDAQNVIKIGQDNVNPAYDAIRADPTPVMTPVLQGLIDTDPHVQSAIASVVNNTRKVPGAPLMGVPAPPSTTPDISSVLGKNADPEAVSWMQNLLGGTPQTPAQATAPTASTWLAVRQQLADNVERDPVTGKPTASYNNAQINSASADLTNALKSSVPGFSEAQEQAATYKAPQASFNNARGMLFGAGAKNNLNSVQTLWAAAKTPEQQAAIKQAFASDINDVAYGGRGGNKLQPSAFTGPGVKSKLAIVFGPAAAKNVADLGAAEGELANNSARISPRIGPVTSQVLLNDGDNGGRAAAIDAGKAVLDQAKEGKTVGALTAAGAHLGGFLAKRAGSTADAAFKQALANQYFSDAANFTAPASAARASSKSISSPLATTVAAQYLGGQIQGNSQ